MVRAFFKLNLQEPKKVFAFSSAENNFRLRKIQRSLFCFSFILVFYHKHHLDNPQNNNTSHILTVSFANIIRYMHSPLLWQVKLQLFGYRSAISSNNTGPISSENTRLTRSKDNAVACFIIGFGSMIPKECSRSRDRTVLRDEYCHLVSPLVNSA